METIFIFILRMVVWEFLMKTESLVKPEADAARVVFPDGAVALKNAALNEPRDRL